MLPIIAPASLALCQTKLSFLLFLPLLFLIFLCVYTHVHMFHVCTRMYCCECTYVMVHEKAGDNYQLSYSVMLHLTFGDRVLLMSLGFANLAPTLGQQVAVVLANTWETTLHCFLIPHKRSKGLGVAIS